MIDKEDSGLAETAESQSNIAPHENVLDIGINCEIEEKLTEGT